MEVGREEIEPPNQQAATGRDKSKTVKLHNCCGSRPVTRAAVPDIRTGTTPCNGHGHPAPLHRHAIAVQRHPFHFRTLYPLSYASIDSRTRYISFVHESGVLSRDCKARLFDALHGAGGGGGIGVRLSVRLVRDSVYLECIAPGRSVVALHIGQCTRMPGAPSPPSLPPHPGAPGLAAPRDFPFPPRRPPANSATFRCRVARARVQSALCDACRNGLSARLRCGAYGLSALGPDVVTSSRGRCPCDAIAAPLHRRRRPSYTRS
ncbi:unnamed protein product, partial [Iphiclides podalirius]